MLDRQGTATFILTVAVINGPRAIRHTPDLRVHGVEHDHSSSPFWLHVQYSAELDLLTERESRRLRVEGKWASRRRYDEVQIIERSPNEQLEAPEKRRFRRRSVDHATGDLEHSRDARKGLRRHDLGHSELDRQGFAAVSVE